MARLNEPPVAPQPSAETIDAVKRRFLRQNRELAKTNSQQSIRIRTLENDCSRLLAENLSLREQVLQLQNSLESHSNRPSVENIDAIKSQLEAKVQELGGLVAELGALKKEDRGPRCKSQTAATRRSPDERQWRSGLGLQEVENQMLPTIVEDKFYPRRTLCADELRGILEDPDSQSPDIGPPPVSRFENEEPIAFNPSPPQEEQSGEPNEDAEPALLVNLETRKKRRESGPKLNTRRVSVLRSPPKESEEGAARTVRIGAKRKFSVQEDEDKVSPLAEPFRFSRRNAPTQSENESTNEEPPPPSPERPILGSKPVNTDPVLSPKKQRSSVQEKPEKPEKKPVSTSKTRGRLTITRNVVQPNLPPFQMPDPIPTAEIHLDSLPPKTPAAEDIFSPPSTEPSTARPETKDTPPPSDLSSGDQTGLGGRPSRRARPQVSYKEPSLNTKMRRPGKELVDAVPTHSDRSSMEPQTAPSTTSKATIKREPSDESNWKTIPSVSGRGADDEAEMGSPLRQKLDRREGNQDAKSVEPPKLNSAAASNAISALINETSTAKRKPATNAINVESRAALSETPESKPQPRHKAAPVKDEPKDDHLAIFDFTDSSPHPPPTTTDTSSSTNRVRINDLAKAARNARRHSSVPTSSVAEERLSSKAEGALSSVHKRTGSGNVKSSSTPSLGTAATGLGRSTAAARASAKEKKALATLPASGASIDLRAKVDGGGVKDGEDGVARQGSLRAASRRKSMMV